MAVSVANALSVPYRAGIGNKKETVTNVTCSEKYTSEGESVTAANLGFSQKVSSAICQIKSLGSESTVNLASAFYDVSTEKLILRDETPAEVASEAEIKKPVIQITARGI